MPSERPIEEKGIPSSMVHAFASHNARSVVVFALLFATLRGPCLTAPVALANPGFELPVLQAPPGTTWFGGVQGWSASFGAGTTYEVSWAPSSPAPEGQQYAFADIDSFDLTQVAPVTLDTTKRYAFTISVFPLQDNPANNLEVAVDIYDPAWSGFARQAYATWHPSWLPEQEDFRLVPLKWNRIQVRFAGADFPTLAGQQMRLRVTGRRCAMDDALFEGFSAGEYPATGGTTYYISQSAGNDAGTGTNPAAPWKTFAPANAMLLRPGDQVLLRRGDIWTEELHLRGTGSPGSPVQLGAWGDAALPRPRIERSDKANHKCVVIQQPSFWRVSSLDCRNAKLGLYLRYHNSWDNQSVEVSDCHFEGMDDLTLEPANHGYEFAWSDAIWLGGHLWVSARDLDTVLDGLTITNCEFRRAAHGFGTAFYYPLPAKDRVRNFTMRDCRALDCLQGGFALTDVTSGTIERVDSYGGGSDSWAGSTLGFFQSCSGVTARDCMFAYCDRRESGDGVGFDFEGDTDNCSIADSTFFNNSGSGVLILSTNGANLNVTISRCIFYMNCLNPWNSEINSEIGCGFSGNTGTISNCGFYRRDAQVNFTSPSNFGGFTFTGNRYATYDPSREKRWWNFDTPGDLEGWNSFNDWQSPTVAGGALTGASSTGVDPYAHSPLSWVNARLQPYLWLRLAHTQGSWAQMFYVTDTDPVWSGDKVATVPVIPDGLARDYWVDLRGGNFKGMVTQVRLDPPFEPGSAPLIDHVRFTGSTDLAQAAPVPPPAAPLEMTFVSIASEDGQVLESAAGSNLGGTATSSGGTNPLGDTAANQRSRLVYSFDTSALPDNAVITDAQLRFTRTGVTGSDPWTFGGSLAAGGYGYADIAGQLGSSTALEAADWQAAAAADRVAKFIVPYSDGLAVMDLLNTAGLAQISVTGRTQFRVYTDPGTDNDNGQDTISVASGSNGTTANRPQLRVWYYAGSAPTRAPRPDYPSEFTPPLQVPRAPVVSGPQDTSLLLTIPLDGNPLTAQYALWCENLGKWVRADGSLGDTPVWRTAATWGAMTVTGLPRNATHSFSARARRADSSGETINGPPGSLATTPAAVSRFSVD
jgi:hypothetical protein